MVLILSFFALVLVIMMCVILQPSFADEIDAGYGEYESIGNTWVEVTHSAANPPPWKLDWYIDHPSERYPGFLTDKQHEEIDIIKKFYQKHNMTIIDAIRSDKNAQLCEAIGCLFGTYHLLIPNEDVGKSPHANFGFVMFADSGIIESFIGGDGTSIAHWKAEKIFLSTDGKFELNLTLSYDSPDPTTATYYSTESSREVFVEVDELNFVDSMIILVYPYGTAGPNTIPINADSISSKRANIQYSNNLDFPHKSLYGDRIEFGLGWIRIFEDENDQRYYQWMRSDSRNLLHMNKAQKTNGTFFVYSPFPEFAHKSDDSSLRGFDYVKWIKENIYSDFAYLSPKLQQQHGISSDQIMCKNGMIKMKKISTDSVLCIKYGSSQRLAERGYAVFLEEITSSEILCKSYDGKWLEQFKECENVSEQACKMMSGSYDECGSMCRHDPPQDEPVACLMGCVRLCTVN